MEETKTPLRMQRIVIAALLAHLIPLLLLVAVITGFAYLVSPDQDSAVYQGFATKAGKIMNPVAGALATFGLGYWAARKPEHRKIMYGLLTGVLVVFIELAILATPGTEFSWSEGLGMPAKLLAGYLGGYAAQRSSVKHAGEEKEGHRFF